MGQHLVRVFLLREERRREGRGRGKKKMGVRLFLL
jgi:hypothetical protein